MIFPGNGHLRLYIDSFTPLLSAIYSTLGALIPAVQIF